MAVFDLTTSRVVRAVHREKNAHGRGWTTLRWAARVMVAVAVLTIVMSILLDPQVPVYYTGVSLIVMGVSLALLVVDLYLRTRWSALPDLPPLPQVLTGQPSLNLADYLSREAVALIEAGAVMQKTIIAGAGSDIHPFVMFLAGIQGPAQGVLARLGIVISDETVKQIITQEGSALTPPAHETFVRLFEVATEEVLRDNRARIDEIDILIAIIKEDERAANVAFNFQIELVDLINVGQWLRRIRARQVPVPLYARPLGPGIGQDWTSGYTPFLSQFAANVTREVSSLTQPLIVYGREKELDTMERLLAKQQGHNILLVGEPGIGKQTLILALAQRLYQGTHGSPLLRYLQILRLDINALLAGVSDRGEIEARLLRVFAEAANAGNIILVVPEIHQLIGGGERVGGVDATELLMNALNAPNLHIVATTTPNELQTRIAPNPTLLAMFERLDVPEPDETATLEILEEAVLGVEVDTNIFVTEPALKTMIEIAGKVMHDQPFPQKALNILLEVASYASSGKIGFVTPDVVRTALSERLKLPLSTAQGEEKDILLNLEDRLHETVVDQEEAITAIADALRRARAGLASGKRPIASLLFLGPTGVGKTESAKALARVYFGSEDRMIRIDMSEYQQADGIARLIGTPVAAGEKAGGFLTDQVHDQPFSLVLLDEFEKAHPQILNLFLQVLDDGRLTDGSGRVIDFTNAIIIATSNAGAEIIRQSIAAGEDQGTRRAKLLDLLQQQGIYRPELLNRFDGIVAFRPLAPEHVIAIIRIMLGQVAQKLASEQQITVTFSNDLIAALARVGFDPQFGARPIRRVIQDKVESRLAQLILSGNLVRGGTVAITAAAVGL